jgi:hypothetical protein
MKAVAAVSVVTLLVAVAGLTAPAQADPTPAQSRAGRAGNAEPTIERIVLEDDSVRIDELRVRGLTQRISVRPKARGAKPYEIVPTSGGSDPSQPRGNAGQRQWTVWSF